MFTRPTLTELVDRIEQDFMSRLDLNAPLLRRAVVKIMSRVWAGAAHMLHGHLAWLAKQIFADTADDENVLRQAKLFGLELISAAFAEGTIEFEDSTESGHSIAEGTLLVRADGQVYETTEPAVSDDGGVFYIDDSTFTETDIPIRAVEAGSAGTLVSDSTLTMQSPDPFVDSTVLVTGVTIDGSDQETVDELQVRLLERLAEPAHGGNDADFIAWSKEVAGVTRVWVTSNGLGPGTVLVLFTRDNDASPIPDSGEVTALQTYLDTKKPSYAAVSVVAPSAAVRNFTFSSLTPNTAAVQDAIEAELADLILREGEPGGTILLSAIRTAIGNAAGVTDYVLTVPSADVTHVAGQIPTMGTVTFP